MQVKIDNRLITAILLFFPIAGISNYIAYNFIYTIGKSFFLLYLALLFCLVRNAKVGKSYSSPSKILPLSIVLIFSVALIRTYFFDSKLIGFFPAIVLIGTYSLVYYIGKLLAVRHPNFNVAKYFIISFIIYFVFNVLFMLLGVHNPAVEKQYIGELETIFSFIRGRKMLPFSSGLIDSSLIALVSGVGSFLLYTEIKDNSNYRVILKIILIAVVLMSFAMMVFSGGRTAILLLIYFWVAIIINLQRYKKIALSLTILAFFFPLVYIPSMLPLYSSGGLEFLESFSRTGDISEVLLLNNRVLIWGAVINYLYDNFDIFNILFGYGMYGQTVSGAVDLYNFLFSATYSSTEAINVHSSFLQILINYGLIGIVLYLLVIIKTVLSIYDNKPSKMLFYLIHLFIVATMIEAQLAVDSYFFLFFILMVSYVIHYTNNRVSNDSLVSRRLSSSLWMTW